MSLWLVRPKTMIGAEFDYFSYARHDFWPSVFDGGFDHDGSSFLIRGSFTIQRLLSKRPFHKLVYLSYNHTSLQSQTDYTQLNTNGSGGSLELGYGVLFCYFKSISVLFKQGFAYELYPTFPNTTS